MKIPVYLLFMFVSMMSCAQKAGPFQELRNRMVRTQIKDRGITDERILEAFRNVERHKFVPDPYIPYAYNDSPLPIAEGQTISQPYIVAYMTDALELKKNDKVLEIGTGSGYQAAILAEICDSVFTIEIFESLGQNARSLFNRLGYDNIMTKIGDGYKGWPQYAPFDAIIVTASPERIPEPLKEQLAEGGRMIIPVGDENIQHLVLLRKRKGKIREEQILPVRFVPMIDSTGIRY
ncbi:MAG: protein-L-isoaspartate(D-aspartate) O-methyltransferase [Mariniphaga sp.]